MSQASVQPFACRMLETLSKSSLYVLQGTLFLLMMSSIEEISTTATKTVAIVLILVLNIGLVLLFLWRLFMELRVTLVSTLDTDGDGKVSWSELKAYCQKLVGRSGHK